MSMICVKGCSCTKAKCVHYRYDYDEDRMCCFALSDFETLGIRFIPEIHAVPADEIIKIYNIDWDLGNEDDGKNIELPSVVNVTMRELHDSEGICEDSIAHYLADKYGFCVNSYNSMLDGDISQMSIFFPKSSEEVFDPDEKFQVKEPHILI